MLKIINAEWTPKYNLLIIRCDCRGVFKHRADRWVVKCPDCLKQENLGHLRDQYSVLKKEKDVRDKCKQCFFTLPEGTSFPLRCPRCKANFEVAVPTTIVHCRRKAYDIYIGRPSEWGNPFKIGTDGTREEVIREYRRWISTQPDLLKKIHTLKGKVLGCWCAEDRILTATPPYICHGQVLAKLADES